VLSVMVCAMGMGSLLAKRFSSRPATAFVILECALALVGGLSVLVLYGCWAWLGYGQTATVLLAAVIGVLMGAEIPLLMTLVQCIRRQEAGRAAADLFAADYVGALAGGLAFPFLLLPTLGQATGALLTGAVNAGGGALMVLWLFRHEPAPRTRLLLWVCCCLVLLILAAAAAFSGAMEQAARHALYGDRLRQVRQSRGQEIVLTGGAQEPLRLFLDGRLLACTADEYRAHEALVRPAIAGPHRRLLVLGGGDGLAVREALRHTRLREVVVVNGDPAVTSLARTDPELTALNQHALEDPRVRLVTADPLGWLRGPAPRHGLFDVVVADLPDLAWEGSAALYTEEFYGLAARRLGPGGRLAVHVGPPGPEAVSWQRFWAVEAAVRKVGLRTVPYEAPVGMAQCGDPPRQGFLLAARRRPQLTLAGDAPPPRSLSGRTLAPLVSLVSARPDPAPPPPTLLRSLE
jgi:spermidine synthase